MVARDRQETPISPVAKDEHHRQGRALEHIRQYLSSLINYYLPFVYYTLDINSCIQRAEVSISFYSLRRKKMPSRQLAKLRSGVPRIATDPLELVSTLTYKYAL